MTAAILSIALAVATSGDRRIWAVAAVIGAALVAPILGVVGGAAFAAVWAMRRIPRRERSASDEALVAEVVALGLSAGLSFPAAAGAAADAVPGETSSGLMRSIRQRNDPSHASYEETGLYVVARRALSTGAPLLPAVSGYASVLRSDERAHQLAAIRRLPVKLLFPLALLILPGFLILTVAPAVLGSLDRLGL
ncbi:MAG: hypothetical protein ABFR89_04010 [Actinomycetota bacterium]